MRMLVVGAGATGAYFGGRLIEAGRDVTFLVRPKRADQIATNGLRVSSPHGDMALTPKVVTAPQLTTPFDIVLLTVKGYALDGALADMAPAVGPDTMVLSTLNGMRHLDRIADRFGKRCVVGCVCKVSTTLDDNGHVAQLAKFHELSYGERDGSKSARTEALDAFIKGAGFDARLTPTIEREMWEKWIMLSSLGAITCLMRGTIGDIAAAPGGTDFALALLDEVVGISTDVGEAPSEPFLASTRAQLTSHGSAFASSMYRDLVKGNPIEADQIVGDMLVRANAAGIKAPLLAAAYTHLCVYQSRLARPQA